MYRIRLHGRGGQGMKTAGRILGTAFFQQGFEVQDAPRYGAERRGAPVFATVRASREPIHERGVIDRPDLVVVSDETLVPVAAAGVLLGISERTVLLINSVEDPAVWKARLNLAGRVLTLPAAAEEAGALRFVGAACAAAAARLLGVIPAAALERAIRDELADQPEEVLAENLRRAAQAWEALAAHHGCVSPAPDAADAPLGKPDWIDLPFESARISAPHVHAAATSVQVRTGLWRTMRPVIDHDHCNRCTWVCTTFCPDGAIGVDAQGAPRIDYDHCKGCLICVAVCPPHAIAAVSEARAAGTKRPEGAP